MEIKECILGRRSIRSFDNRVVPEKLLFEILDMARWAPSHCNTQKIKFIIVNDPQLHKELFDYGGSILITGVNQGILALYDNRSDNLEYLDYVQSCSAALQNLCLSAYSLGLGTCWICHLPPQKVLRKLFKIPSYYDPIAYILIGYPKNKPAVVPRKYPLDKIISYNGYNFQRELQKSMMLKRIGKRIYYSLPVFIKRRINRYIDRFFVKKFDN